MLKIGLTGGIGSGKSTVSEMFKKEGIPVIDADIISRQVLSEYNDVLISIRNEFGEEFFDQNGMLNRRMLGNYIFSDKKYQVKLENIIIPYIKLKISEYINEYKNKNYKVCVVDAPTLIEHGLNKEMDLNIVVYVNRNIQVERVMIRDNCSEIEAVNRINAQMPIDEKLKFADIVIDNSSGIEKTKEEFIKTLNKINNFKE